MAFLKFAKASVVEPFVTHDTWAELRSKSLTTAFGRKKASSVLQGFDPNQYILSHATIMASVDVEDGPGPTGRQLAEGLQIDRRFLDYYITPESSRFVNNNGDSWSRRTLLSSFHTFIGAENYCFLPGTLVVMADGTQKVLEDVKVGDLVLTHEGRSRKVVRTFVREVDENILSIYFDRYKTPIKCTKEHPFRKLSVQVPATRHYKRSSPESQARYRRDMTRKALRDGEGVFAERVLTSPGWVEARNLSEYDFVLGPQQSIQEGGDLHWATLLGYYLAEGCLLRNESGRIRGIILTFGGHEASLADHAQQLAETWLGAKTNRRSTQCNTIRLEIVGPGVGDWFLKHGGEYSESKKISSEAMGWSRNALLSVLAGWASGDAQRHKKTERVVGSTTSPDLACQMFRICEIVGVKASLWRETEESFELRRQSVSSVTLVVGGAPKNFQVRPEHPQFNVIISRSSVAKFKNLTPRWSNSQSRPSHKRDDFSWMTDGVRVHQVSWVGSEHYKGPVYNLEVEEDNSYVLGQCQVAVHNCEHLQIPELSKGKIVDAAARDIGDSVYIDILVATDRRHTPLIAAIESGQLQTLSMGCFFPGTPITMADGTRLPIEEVAPGDMVLTHKGRPREVLNKQIRGGTWSMRRISVVGLPDDIEATDNHPFFVIRPAKVCACGCGEALSTGDLDPVRRMTKRFRQGHQLRILNPNGSYSLEEAQRRRNALSSASDLKVEQVRADELVLGDYVIFPKFSCDVVSDPGTAKARLLGYFLAEGSFLKHKGVPVEVQFNFDVEEKNTFVTEVVQLLQESFPGSKPWVQDRPDRGVCTVHVTGKDLVKWFYLHGGEYSHKKRLSLAAMAWSKESHKSLLGAWINGDGHLRADGVSVGTTVSYDLVCQLHTMAVQCGIPVRLECLFGGRTATIAEAVANGVARRHEVTGKLASFNLCFPRSAHTVLSSVCSKAPKKCSKDRHLRVLEDMVIFPITNIETFEYSGPVHNMEVEGDNSYQVHGVATHNCQVSYTQCSKCGNVAEDETQLCSHVRFQKRNNFLDPLGKQRIIAELCGHWSEPGSVKFIEASWVANPAFTGAVLRNILTPEEAAALGNRVQVAFSEAPRVASPNSMQRAARTIQTDRSIRRDKRSFDFGTQEGDETPSTESPGQEDPMDKAVSEMADYIREKAIDKVRQEMSKSLPPRADLDENRNDTLIREAIQKSPEWRRLAKVILSHTNDPSRTKKLVLGLLLYRSGGWKSVQAASFTGTDILALSQFLDRFNSIPKMAGEARVYRTIVAVGGVAPYSNEESYLAACRRVIGRELTGTEKDALLAKGRLYDLGT